MKAIYILIFSILLSVSAYAGMESSEKYDSSKQHTIVRDEGFFFTTYTIDGEEADVDDVEGLLASVSDASDMWSTGNVLHYVAYGLSFAGGFTIGYSAVIGSGYDAPEGYKLGIAAGIGLVVVGLILDHVSSSKKNGAIELYNSESGKTSQAPWDQHSFNIELAPTPEGGIGLAFNF